jgi:hypothetical protein
MPDMVKSVETVMSVSIQCLPLCVGTFTANKVRTIFLLEG